MFAHLDECCGALGQVHVVCFLLCLPDVAKVFPGTLIGVKQCPPCAPMKFAQDAETNRRAVEYFETTIGQYLNRVKQRASFATYAFGILGDAKITNCPIGVSLCVSNRRQQAPIDFEHYLPNQWTDDVALRKEMNKMEIIGIIKERWRTEIL